MEPETVRDGLERFQKRFVLSIDRAMRLREHDWVVRWWLRDRSNVSAQVERGSEVYSAASHATSLAWTRSMWEEL